MNLKRCTRCVGIALVVTALLLSTGSQCATDTRHSFVAGYLDFVQGATESALFTLFPIEDIINGLLQRPA